MWKQYLFLLCFKWLCVTWHKSIYTSSDVALIQFCSNANKCGDGRWIMLFYAHIILIALFCHNSEWKLNHPDFVHHVVLLSCFISADSSSWDTLVMEREINLTWSSMRNTQPSFKNDSSSGREIKPCVPGGARHCNVLVVTAARHNYNVTSPQPIRMLSRQNITCSLEHGALKASQSVKTNYRSISVCKGRVCVCVCVFVYYFICSFSAPLWWQKSLQDIQQVAGLVYFLETAMCFLYTDHILGTLTY